MDQDGIIRDLLSWLDSQLEQLLSLDNVVAKAGYSKWHLQRMFKEVTGHAIGAYIRARRLSKAALALRLTSQLILNIALQYRFDSQQTFTRAFKKLFAQAPALYRRKEKWDCAGIRPPIRLDIERAAAGRVHPAACDGTDRHHAKLHLHPGAAQQLSHRTAHPFLAPISQRG